MTKSNGPTICERYKEIFPLDTRGCKMRVVCCVANICLTEYNAFRQMEMTTDTPTVDSAIAIDPLAMLQPYGR